MKYFTLGLILLGFAYITPFFIESPNSLISILLAVAAVFSIIYSIKSGDGE